MPWRETARLAQQLNGSVHHPEYMHIGIMLEQSSAMARIETNVEHIKDKLHEHGERLASLERPGTKPGGAWFRNLLTRNEALTFLWGALILAMAGAGKLDWKLAASVLPRF
jgi:hypothetical protein